MKLYFADLLGEVSSEVVPKKVPDVKRPPIAPWTLKPMVNVFQGENGPCYIWLQFVPGCPDLELKECEHSWEGIEPEWFHEEKGSVGLDTIIDIPWNCHIEWMLSEGLSPGQPFCVEVYPPSYYKCSYEYDEWDCEWAWSVVRIMPRKLSTAASSWKRHLDNLQRDQEQEERIKARVHTKRMNDLDALYLQWERFYAYGYDGDAPPGGERVSLCSKHTGENGRNYFSPVLFTAESCVGDREEVLTQLVERAHKEGMVIRSKWERLRKPWRKSLLSEAGLRGLPSRR
jgi:hypothetical protein